VLDTLLGTPVVADELDEGLTPWTVKCPVEQEGRCVRQTSCPGHYAVVTLRVEPHHGTGSVVFLNATQADHNTQAWVPAAEEGIRQFLAEQAKQGKRIIGVRVGLARLSDHPVDSRAASFERAASSALTKAFEAAAIPGPPG
jgi:elongation factor G